jgi:hypothetical protein
MPDVSRNGSDEPSQIAIGTSFFGIPTVVVK